MISSENHIRNYKRVGLLGIWVASLVIAGRWGSAQVVPKTPETPSIISGNDIGFRVEGRKGETITGTVVVRMNGVWVATAAAESVKPLTFK